MAPASKGQKNLVIPRTRAEKEECKKAGKITEYFKLPRGAPPKKKKRDGSPPEALPSKQPEPPAKKQKTNKRGAYVKWEVHADIMQMHVDAKRENRPVEYLSMLDGEVEQVPSRSTVKSTIKKLEELEKELSRKCTVSELYERDKDYRTLLLSLSDRKRLEDCIARQAARKSPIDRREIFQFMSELTGKAIKTCENHYDYLVNAKLLTKLKNSGKVVVAQKTTTNRIQANAETQFRFHGAIDCVWERMIECNLPDDEFKAMRAHFQGNLDESCVLANDGNIKVVSAASLKKTEKNMDDCHLSTTMVQMGNAAGSSGP